MLDLLNRAQYVSLAIALSGFERNLRQAESWLRGESDQGVLFHASLSLSPERRSAALCEISTALQLIARLAKRFGLQPADEPLVNKISAEMSMNWANLINTCSGKLGRYGPADPRLRELLDPELENLAHLALSIGTLVRETEPCPDSK